MVEAGEEPGEMRLVFGLQDAAYAVVPPLKRCGRLRKQDRAVPGAERAILLGFLLAGR